MKGIDEQARSAAISTGMPRTWRFCVQQGNPNRADGGERLQAVLDGFANAAIGSGLSAGSFQANETALLLNLLAFNLAGIVRGRWKTPRATGGTSRA